jgi:hypothetical protein
LPFWPDKEGKIRILVTKMRKKKMSIGDQLEKEKQKNSPKKEEHRNIG